MCDSCHGYYFTMLIVPIKCAVISKETILFVRLFVCFVICILHLRFIQSIAEKDL